jgi:hypothetical protein
MKGAMRIGLLVLPVLALLGLAVYAAWTAWNAAGDTEMGGHGVVAMVLGALFTMGLTGVLVGLLLYSRRHGYDR